MLLPTRSSEAKSNATLKRPNSAPEPTAMFCPAEARRLCLRR